MAALLWQKTILPESILTSGLGASGATPEFDSPGRPVIQMPVDDTGDVSVVLRCGRIVEAYAATGPLKVRLRFFTNSGAYSFTFKVQCCAKGPGEDVGTQDWNAEESSTSGTFPITTNELDEAQIRVSTGIRLPLSPLGSFGLHTSYLGAHTFWHADDSSTSFLCSGIIPQWADLSANIILIVRICGAGDISSLDAYIDRVVTRVRDGETFSEGNILASAPAAFTIPASTPAGRWRDLTLATFAGSNVADGDQVHVMVAQDASDAADTLGVAMYTAMPVWLSMTKGKD